MSQPNFAARPGLLLAVIAAGAAATALAIRDLPPWLATQRRYGEQHTLDPGLRAAPLGPVAAAPPDGLEYCTSCHLAGAGYEPGEGVFAAHPEVGHDPLELGCTPCHKGDPGALTTHEAPAFGHDVPLPGALAWVSCLQCHDAATQPALLAPWPVAATQERLTSLFATHGCLACHRAGGRGGLVGPDLSAFGATPVSDPTAPYQGRREQAQRQLEDPRALRPDSAMPTPDLEPDERALLAIWLGFQGHITGLDAGRWVPGAPGRLDDGEALYAWLCQPCHGADGEGRERGRAPGAVPALGSALWRAYTAPALIRQVVAHGRPGSQMEAFRGEDSAPILTEEELERLVEHVTSGALAEAPDPAGAQAAAAGSCATCHPRREDYRAEQDPAARAAVLTDHPWRWDLEDWLLDEGLTIETCDLQVADAEGQPTVVHAGEHLYGLLCIHCHQDPDLQPPGHEPSAPSLRGILVRPEHDAGYLLSALVIGRPDAPPVKWRHQGITAAEYTPTELACLVRWLEERP